MRSGKAVSLNQNLNARPLIAKPLATKAILPPSYRAELCSAARLLALR